MKFTLIIDENSEEEVVVRAKENNEIIEKIRDLVEEKEHNLIGFIEREAVILKHSEIICFFTQNNKSFAKTTKTDYELKTRLYEIEENLPDNFIKINKSCIANIDKIKKFSAVFSGALQVNFENGYTDYVSRRNIKKIKERFGI